MRTAFKVWYFRIGAGLCIAVPWLPKLMDRLAHVLDLGCTGLH